MSFTVEIGAYAGSHAVSSSIRAVEAFLGSPPVVHAHQGYAGDNDFVRVLLDLKAWQKIALAGAAAVGGGFFAQAGADGWELTKNLVLEQFSGGAPDEGVTQFVYLMDEANRASDRTDHNRASIYFGLPPNEKWTSQILIQIPRPASRDKIVLAAALLVAVGRSIQDKIDELTASGRRVIRVVCETVKANFDDPHPSYISVVIVVEGPPGELRFTFNMEGSPL